MPYKMYDSCACCKYCKPFLPGLFANAFMCERFPFPLSYPVSICDSCLDHKKDFSHSRYEYLKVRRLERELTILIITASIRKSLAEFCSGKIGV